MAERSRPGAAPADAAESRRILEPAEPAEPRARARPPRRRASPAPSASSGSSCSSADGCLAEARPPDGGWGWVVVAAAFFVNLIADGITFSFGVIFHEFLEYFGESKATTSWIGSLFMAMPLLSGPVASFLTDRYGCRRVTVAGSVLATLGFVVSYFASSLGVLVLTFGVLAGFGLSLCFVAAVVIVAYYFERRRSFATGLSLSGSGIGTFLFPPLIQRLLAEYGWRGATLVLAGLFLNLAVCGCLMRDLPWTTVRSRERGRRRRAERRRRGPPAGAEPPAAAPGGAGGERFSSLLSLPTFVRGGEGVPPEVLELLSNRRGVYEVLLRDYPSLLVSSRGFGGSGGLRSPLAGPPVPGGARRVPHIAEEDERGGSREAFDAQVAPRRRASLAEQPRRPPTAYLRDIRVHRHSLTYRGAMLNINRYRLRASSCPDIYRNSMTTIAKAKWGGWRSGLRELADALRDMLDLSHFASPRFLLFCISNFLLHTWYDVPYMYLTDNAIEMGFSESQGSYLISVIGITNMGGEVLFGWAGDRAWLNPSVVYALCMAACGAFTALVPLAARAYYPLCALAGAFGFFVAANYSLTSIILVEAITLERFTNAYGLLLLVQGVANLMGPPIAGWLYDITGTYDLSFYLAGTFIGLSGLMLLVIPLQDLYSRYKKSNQRASDQTKAEPKFDGINSV